MPCLLIEAQSKRRGNFHAAACLCLRTDLCERSPESIVQHFCPEMLLSIIDVLAALRLFNLLCKQCGCSFPQRLLKKRRVRTGKIDRYKSLEPVHRRLFDFEGPVSFQIAEYQLSFRCVRLAVNVKLCSVRRNCKRFPAGSSVQPGQILHGNAFRRSRIPHGDCVQPSC